MAKLIPPTYHADTRSKGEIEIFLRLRDDPSTEGWTVLHSFYIAVTRALHRLLILMHEDVKKDIAGLLHVQL